MQDIGSGVEVGMENNSTRLADEGRALPLSSIQIPTDEACSGSILSPDEFNGNSRFLSLVNKELFQLVESPVGKQPILFSPKQLLHLFLHYQSIFG